MMKKNYITVLSIIFIALLHLSVSGAERPPNFVFMFADDLGYRDLGCYGHPYAKTPTLDKLASEGAMFTQAYAAGTSCMPSRTGIMTGISVGRFANSVKKSGFGDRSTITELLHRNGYAVGHFGKWHIGPNESGKYGIDEYDRCGPRDIFKAVIPEGRDAPIYDKAIDFIKRHKDKPFYVNVWGFSTHNPVVSHADLLAEFSDVKVDPNDFSEFMQQSFEDSAKFGGDLDLSMRHYLANVHALDRNVKSLLEALDELGLRDNTVVVFSSDHGPPRVGGTRSSLKQGYSPNRENLLGDTGVFRGNKGTNREGGVRIPFIIRWPKQVGAGVVNTKDVIGGVDWFPSICELAGVSDVPDDIDGEDVSDILLGTTRERRKPLFWTGDPGLAIRDGYWKYYILEKGGFELYQILDDPAESKNLVEQYPEVAERLNKKLLAWSSKLGKTQN